MFNLFLTQRFFLLFGLVAGLFCLSFGWSVLLIPGYIALVLAAFATLFEALTLLLMKKNMRAERRLEDVLALGEDNDVLLVVKNGGAMRLHFQVIDELPAQLQKRNFSFELWIKSGGVKNLPYTIKPVTRGQYHFGKVQLLFTTVIGLMQRKMALDLSQTVKVYPSFPLMKAMELHGLRFMSNSHGEHRVRRRGHSYEFDHIKSYVPGDDIRYINWKASSRMNKLVVNHFEEERGQHVYSIVDKSRLMHLAFNNMRYLDYAINTSLALGNLVIKKRDRAGLITFGKAVDTFLPGKADSRQLLRLVDKLYAEQTEPVEANFESLYMHVKKQLRTRSLLVLYTNFESIYSMEHAIPVLQKLHHRHLLLVVIFENDEVMDFIQKDVQYTTDVYEQIVARKLLDQKHQMVAELRNRGIHAMLTSPEDLAINTIEQYLKFKQAGLI